MNWYLRKQIKRARDTTTPFESCACLGRGLGSPRRLAEGVSTICSGQDECRRKRCPTKLIQICGRTRALRTNKHKTVSRKHPRPRRETPILIFCMVRAIACSNRPRPLRGAPQPYQLRPPRAAARTRPRATTIVCLGLRARAKRRNVWILAVVTAIAIVRLVMARAHGSHCTWHTRSRH